VNNFHDFSENTDTSTRQTGSHLRLTSSRMGSEHHITIPAHRNGEDRYIERYSAVLLSI
jgi:hypothetical protein